MTSPQPILIVEDNDDDFESTQDALMEQQNFRNPIYRCRDGQEALDYLYRQNKYSDPSTSPKPGLILLDLNMPGVDGRSVLEKLNKDDEFVTPVIVFTTSGDPLDIQECYSAGASSYVQKPITLEGLVEAIQRIHDYWFEIVILPKG